jgi:uncharacterized protein YegP (UPF0339 family)
MINSLHVHHYLDANNEYRARVVAGNGEPLFVSSEGYNREEDLIVSQELTRQALNAYYNDPVRKAKTDAAMARRDARMPGSRLANALLNALPAGNNALMDFHANPMLPENALMRARPGRRL